MLWSSQVVIDLINYSNSHIHVKNFEPVTSNGWLLIGFYNNPKTNRRQYSWVLISIINKDTKIPW